MIKYQFIQRNDGWYVRRIEMHERLNGFYRNNHWLAVVRRGDDYFEHDWQTSDNNAHRFQTYEQAFNAVFQERAVEITGYDYGHCFEVEL